VGAEHELASSIATRRGAGFGSRISYIILEASLDLRVSKLERANLDHQESLLLIGWLLFKIVGFEAPIKEVVLTEEGPGAGRGLTEVRDVARDKEPPGKGLRTCSLECACDETEEVGFGNAKVL
jgi:hypothetical protein